MVRECDEDIRRLLKGENLNIEVKIMEGPFIICLIEPNSLLDREIRVKK